MDFDRPPKKSENALSWVEWIVAIGTLGLALSLVIFAFLACLF
ncbi:MAG: hypothetical protein ABSA17_01860 [Rhabdochlamydiaceae bacterium]|jgi:hypothetical protein